MSLQGLDDRVWLPGPKPWVVRGRGLVGLHAPRPPPLPGIQLLPTLRRPLLTTSIYRRTPIPTPWSLPPTAKSHEEHCNIWAP